MNLSKCDPETARANFTAGFTDDGGQQGRNYVAEWFPIWLMPNLRVEGAIEAPQAALVGWSDPRLAEICKESAKFNSFLTRFTDAFGVEQRPAVLLAKTPKAGRKVAIEAVASFRDLVSICTVPYARALMIVYENQRQSPIYSNSFWLYPWMLNMHNQHLVTSSMAGAGLHVVEEFKGQSTPEIFSTELDAERDVDRVLLSALLERWEARYFGQSPSWQDRALFRAINMANVACALPTTVDLTIFDVGRSLALWVSAFEILVHPGIGKSGLSAVYRVLDEVEWTNRKLSKKLYRAYDPRLKRTPATLARSAYGQLYQQRNDFLHGNPVRQSALRFNSRGRHLLHIAPCLFRLALTSVLDLRFKDAVPPASDVSGFIAYRERQARHRVLQHTYEWALTKAKQPPKPRGSVKKRVSRAG